ncbi:hypothetical protein [Streptomyces fungicidicus]|uniref:hypothetical protein n=1 Tax=Streptomyces fungicidicus TaxID=68203 RepID=UPI003D754148
MPSLPPPIWAELFYGGAWNDVAEDVRATTSQVSVTRGLSSESAAAAEPTSCTCDLDSRDDRYAPRNPSSPLFGLIGRNTPFRWGYEVGSLWAELNGGLNYGSLFANNNPVFNVTGDFDLRIDVALEDWSESQMLALRYQSTGDQRSWALEILNGTLTFMWSPNGLLAARIVQAATEPVRGYNGQRMALRVTLDINNGSGGYELRFWTGRTVNDTDWHLLGAPIVGTGTTSVYAGTGYMEVGAGFDFNATPAGGSLNRMRGRAYALQLRDSGTVKVDMSTASATVASGSFVDATGVTWSRGGDAVWSRKHVRMTGEVPAWPPTRDVSGNDNYVSINPSGLLRRMDAGNRPQESALLRYIKTRGPIECWPLTDGPRTTGAKSLVGGQDMQQEILIGEDTAADWQQGSLADWIEPVLSVKAETTGHLRGGLPNRASAASFWSVDLFLSGGGIPAAGQVAITDRGAGTDAENRTTIRMIFTGSLNQLTVVRESAGDTSSSSGLLANLPAAIYDEQPHHLRLTIDPLVSSTDWYVYVDGVLAGSGNIGSIAMKGALQLLLGWGFATIDGATMTDRSFGYITYWDATGPTAAQIYNAYLGFQGERAGERITRLATESGYTASVAGEPEYQQRLGIQGQKRLLELLNEASQTNFGYLLDARDRIEVIHRGQSTLWNQSPALTLDYSAGLISPPFKPVDDDRLTENDVSVKREFGSLPAREVLEAGDMSVLPPEAGGVGRYDTAYTYSLETDAQAAQAAGMRLHLGTYNGVRYTRLTLNLANERVFAYIDDILRLDVGDKIRLTRLPADHGPDDVDVLIAGYTEDAGPNGWTLTFNCLPGEPWNAGVTDSFAFGWADTDGSQLAAAVDASATAMSLAVTAGPLWTDDPSDMPFDLRVGGEVVTVTAPGALVNAAQNPFFDTDVASWSAESAALSRSTAVVHPHPRARGSLLITPAGGASFAGAVGTLTGAGSITPGTSYVMSAWVYSPGGWSDVRPTIYWYDAAGNFLSTGSGGALAVPAGQWTFLTSTLAAPASASQARARIRHGATPTATDLLYVWAARLTPTTSGSGPQTFTVVRSVNGVAKAHAVGTDVRLANPVYVAMQ